MAKPRPDVEKQLYVSLDEEELRLKGDHLSARVKQLEDIERRKSASSKALKAEQDAASADASKLADEIKHKREVRPVACRWRMLTERWELYRIDTGEVVDTAPITMADRQGELLS